MHSELVEAVGNNVLSYRTVAKWAAAFQRGRAKAWIWNAQDDQGAG